jgi:hypothetical protein
MKVLRCRMMACFTGHTVNTKCRMHKDVRERPSQPQSLTASLRHMVR